MNVCMVAYTFYEEDNRVRRYAEAFAKRGDLVDVLALRQPGQSRTETIKGVRLFRMQPREVNEKGKLTYLARLLSFFLRSAVFLTSRHFRKRYDLIHVHSVPDFEVFSAVIPKLMGSKVILDIHDLVPEFYCSKFNTPQNSFVFRTLVAIERMSALFSDHVIAANDIWHDRMVKRSVPVEKCTTLLNYPDTDIFRPRGKARNDGKFMILYPGTLNFHQGLDIAIRAFALIEKEAPQAEFHIYGAGDQTEALKSLIGELHLGGKIFLKGRIPLDQIAAVMESADLGIVPKRSDGFGNEAFSTKTLEFMSLGTPLIVPDTRIDRHYFNDSIVQFFHANDEKSLAAVMLALIRNRARRETLARNAAEFVAQYTWDANKSVYFDIVEALLPSSNGARNSQDHLTSDSIAAVSNPATKK